MMLNDIIEEIEQHKNINKNELYEKLYINYSNEKIVFAMYDMFGYIHTDTEEKDIRKNQHEFRKDLIDRYEGCVITGVSEKVCDACHIISYVKCEDKDKYNIDNGILLRSDLHRLFDDGLLKIDPNTCTIILNETIMSNKKMKQYHELNNKKINIHEKSIYFLNKIW